MYLFIICYEVLVFSSSFDETPIVLTWELLMMDIFFFVVIYNLYCWWTSKFMYRTTIFFKLMTCNFMKRVLFIPRCKKYPSMELRGHFQYLVNQLKRGQGIELVLLQVSFRSRNFKLYNFFYLDHRVAC